MMRITQPVVDLLRAPDGPRDRQLLFGDAVEIIGIADGWIHIRALKDGYEGFVPPRALNTVEKGAGAAPTHWVSAPATHTYVAADFKSPDRASFSLGSALCVTGQEGRFAVTDAGYVPSAHLRALDDRPRDPVAVAQTLLGTPYLWGGNSRFGIDCSGLVQVACLACGRACPGDSGPQARSLGRHLPQGSAYARGDLLFWQGHVAWVYDPETILHANAHAMAVVFEPLEAAIARIKDQGDGPVTAHKRLD